MPAQVFVLCPPFHGATLLALLLNNHPRVTALGDTLPLRAHMDYWCSCGQQIQSCAFWQALMTRLDMTRFRNEERLIPEVPRYLNDPDRNLHLIRWLLNESPWVIQLLSLLRHRATREFLDATTCLHRMACDAQRTEIIVDGVKLTWRYRLLRLLSGRRLRVLHVVRDPRGFLCSYRANIGNSLPVEEIAQVWLDYHTAVIRYCADIDPEYYRCVRYEDLCENGPHEMNGIFAFLGIEAADVCKPMQAPHHIIGNRMLGEFTGHIVLDARYQQEISAEEQLRVLALCQPLSGRWGYSLGGQALQP